MSNVIQLKEPPLLFDAALCIKPAAVLRGIEAANEQARVQARAKVDAPLRAAVPAASILRETEEAFALIREQALAQENFVAVEKYIAKTVGTHFGVEVKVFGIAGALARGRVKGPSAINTFLKISCTRVLSKRDADFYIAGGRFDGVQVRLSEFVNFDPEDWIGIYIPEENQ